MKFYNLSLFTFLFCATMFAQPERPLAYEMNRIKVNTVLIAEPHWGIDDYPIWSPDGKYIAINNGGKWWMKINLKKIVLQSSSWLGRTIGSNVVETSDELTEAERIEFTAATKYDPRELTTSKGIKIELAETPYMTTVMRVNSKKIWETGGDNCHSLALSPDENYVAFISESNGLMVMDIGDVYKNVQLPPEEQLMTSILNHFDSGKMSKATGEIEKGITQYRFRSEFWYMKSLLFLAQENFAEAHRYLDSAIVRDSLNSDYLYYKTNLYVEQKFYESALKYIDQYIALRPDLYGYYRKGEILELTGDNGGACEAYRKAEALHSWRATNKLKTCK